MRDETSARHNAVDDTYSEISKIDAAHSVGIDRGPAPIFKSSAKISVRKERAQAPSIVGRAPPFLYNGFASARFLRNQRIKGLKKRFLKRYGNCSLI